MKLTSFKVENRTITKTDENKLIGMVGQDIFSVNFIDEEWSGLHKTMKLIRNDGAIIYLAMLNDEVELTQECYVAGVAELGFFGTINEDDPEDMKIASTDYIPIYFHEHAYSTDSGEAINVPTPTQWDIIIGQMNDIKDHIDDQAQYIEDLINNSSFNPDTLNIRYEALQDKPSINGVTLSGNKTTSELNIAIPDKTSQLINDSGFITQESDPTVPSYVKSITQQDISNWDAKQNPLTAGANVFITNNVISATDTTYNVFTGTDGSTAGSSGLVPAPGTSETGKYLKSDGSWDTPSGGGGGTSDYTDLSNKPSINNITLSGNKTTADLGITIPTKTSDLTNDSGFISGLVVLSYGNSTWNDFINAYNANKVIYCKASSNNDPSTGTQNRYAFMAYVENSSNPSYVEFQYYRSIDSHSDTQQGDQVFKYRLSNNGTWSVLTKEASSKIVAGTGLSSSYSSNTLTITSPTFTGTDGTAAGTAGLVPAPATTDAGKVLKADGTWTAQPTVPTIATTISSASTNDTTVSPLAVYNYVDSMITQAIGGSY